MDDDLKKKFYYSLEGLTPHADEDGRVLMGGFGFNAYLDIGFAKQSYEKILPEGHSLNEIGRNIVVRSGLARRENVHRDPYYFMENSDGELTALLRWVTVPGNACEIGVDGTIYDQILKENWDEAGRSLGALGSLQYGPHNIDTSQQAYALASLFTFWANSVKHFMKKE